MNCFGDPSQTLSLSVTEARTKSFLSYLYLSTLRLFCNPVFLQKTVISGNALPNLRFHSELKGFETLPLQWSYLFSKTCFSSRSGLLNAKTSLQARTPRFWAWPRDFLTVWLETGSRPTYDTARRFLSGQKQFERTYGECTGLLFLQDCVWCFAQKYLKVEFQIVPNLARRKMSNCIFTNLHSTRRILWQLMSGFGFSFFQASGWKKDPSHLIHNFATVGGDIPRQ